MSKKREDRGARSARPSGASNSARVGLIVAAVLVTAAIGFALVGGGAQAATHSEPRATAESRVTVPPSRYTGYPRIHRVYAMAAEIKPTLDGLYCYCRCKEHSDHYSLLTCFESDHGAGCDVCLDQAALAYQMLKQGASLEEIRAQTDRRFGRG